MSDGLWLWLGFCVWLAAVLAYWDEVERQMGAMVNLWRKARVSAARALRTVRGN